MNSKVYLSFEELKRLSTILYDTCEYPDMIVGITRGGLLPAVMLSHMFEAPMTALSWQTRDGNKQQLDYELLFAINAGQKVLFVDDINDSGKTFDQISKIYGTKSNVQYCSLVQRSTTMFKDALYGIRIDSDDWVVFPYEK